MQHLGLGRYPSAQLVLVCAGTSYGRWISTQELNLQAQPPPQAQASPALQRQALSPSTGKKGSTRIPSACSPPCITSAQFTLAIRASANSRSTTSAPGSSRRYASKAGHHGCRAAAFHPSVPDWVVELAGQRRPAGQAASTPRTSCGCSWLRSGRVEPRLVAVRGKKSH